MDDQRRFQEFARLATEQRNPRTLDLDTLDIAGILQRISGEDHLVPAAVAREIRTSPAPWSSSWRPSAREDG